MGKFKEHGVMLYLSNPLYLGFVKLQADKGLGRAYAGLLPFVEGLYNMGYINEEVYEEHKERYSRPLVTEKPLTRKQRKTKKKLAVLKKDFSRVIDQWPTMKPKSRKWWIEKAEKYKDKIPNAKMVLALEKSVPKELFSHG